MRALLTIGAVSVLALSISPPGREKVQASETARSQNKRSPETEAARRNETVKTYSCPEGADGARKNQSGEKEPERRDSAANGEFCLELERPQSAVQEYTRSILGEKGWTVPSANTGEGEMMATRQLTSEELGRVAHTEIGAGQMHFEGGGAYARISLMSLSVGGTQVRMRTRILAKGSTALSLQRMSPWTPLATKGVLENEVLAALEVKCSAKP